MRPAGGDRLSPLEGKNELAKMTVTADGLLVRNKRRVPLSAEAEEFSLRTGPKIWVPTRESGDGSRNSMPSREIPEGIIRRSKAVVSTTVMAGVVAPVSFAGAAAPADLVGTDVPAIAGNELPAVAEVCSSAIDAEGVPLVIRSVVRQCTVIRVGPVWPSEKTGNLIDEVTVPEPLTHSVVGLPVEVGTSSGHSVTMLEPLEHSVVDVPIEVGTSSGHSGITCMLEPLEHSVVGLPVEVGTNFGHSVTVLEPIEHSVVGLPNVLGMDPGGSGGCFGTNRAFGSC